jgi:hypothetical protein
MNPERRERAIDCVEAALVATDDEEVADDLREALSYLRPGDR